MKRFLLCLLFAVCASCATTDWAKYDSHKEEVFLDPSGCWFNRLAKPRSNLVSITLKVVNRRYIAADVSVSCRFDTGDDFDRSKIFGERTVRVDARDYHSFVVRGFQEGHGLTSRLQCRIVSVEP